MNQILGRHIEDLPNLPDNELRALLLELEGERQKAVAAANGNAFNVIQEYERQRTVIEDARFNRLNLLGELDAVFPQEDAVQTLRQRRQNARYAIEKSKPPLPEKYERDANPVLHRQFSHSATTDYETHNWSEINILLEILQNAEPNDSNGTWFGVEIQMKGKWLPLSKLKKVKNDQVQAIRVLDNGGGFSVNELKIFGSSKSRDGDSGGLFGEGGNMADVTARRLGIAVKKYARNWRAIPKLVKERATGRTVEQLHYDVAFYEDILPGTCVEFTDITDGFIDALRTIDDYYLPLQGEAFTPLATNSYGDIVRQKETTHIFVKGRAYSLLPEPEIPLLFGYNLSQYVVKDRNRNNVNLREAEEHINAIWGNTTDQKAIKALLQANKDGVACYELDEMGKRASFDWSAEALDAFFMAACELYGIEDPEKLFRVKGNAFERGEKFLATKGKLQGLDVGGSEFIQAIISARTWTSHDIFSEPAVPGTLFSCEAGDILERGTQCLSEGSLSSIYGDMKHAPYFSYNIKGSGTSGEVHADTFGQRVYAIWRAVDDKGLFTQLIQAHTSGTDCYELRQCSSYSSRDLQCRDVFIDAVDEHFKLNDEDKVYIVPYGESQAEDEKILDARSYKRIDFSTSPLLSLLAQGSGLPHAGEIMSGQGSDYEVDVQPRFAARGIEEKDVLSGIWQRMHGLFEQSQAPGSCSLDIELTDRHGEKTWVPYQKWAYGGTSGIVTTVRFTAQPADISMNDLLYSERDVTGTPSLHSLCSYLSEEEIPFVIQRGNKIIRMRKNGYGHYSYQSIEWDEDERSDEDGSADAKLTLTITPTEDHDLSDGLNALKHDVLSLNPNYKPLATTPHGDLVHLGGQSAVYHHGIVNKRAQTADYIASYNTDANYKEAVPRILESLSDEIVIAAILKRDFQPRERYDDIDNMERLAHPAVWKAAFHKAHGENAVLLQGKSLLGTMVAGQYKYEQVVLPARLTTLLADEAGVATLGALAQIGEYEECPELTANILTVLKFGGNILEWVAKQTKGKPKRMLRNMAWNPDNVRVVTKLANKNGDDLSKLGGIHDFETGEFFVMSDSMGEFTRALNAIISILTYYVSDSFPNQVELNAHITNMYGELFQAVGKSEEARLIMGEKLDAVNETRVERALEETFGTLIGPGVLERLKEKRTSIILGARKKLTEMKIARREHAAERAEEEALARQRREETRRAIMEAIGNFFQQPIAMPKLPHFSMPHIEMPEFSLPRFSLPQFRMPEMPSIRINGKALTLIGAVAAGGWATNELLARKVPQRTAAAFGEMIADAMDAIASSPETVELADKPVYEPHQYTGSYVPSIIYVDNGYSIFREENIRESWRDAVFTSYPNFDPWDNFWISDYEYHDFDGKTWKHDPNAPDFQEQEYANTVEWTHIQSVKSPGEIHLRTQSGGKIDESSIQVIDRYNKLVPFVARRAQNGFALTVESNGADRVVYSTFRPKDWERDANNVRDADYEKLDRATFEYYTKTPSIDLAAIPFKWVNAPGINNWKEWMDYLHEQKPLKRFQLLIEYIQGRRYENDSAKVRSAYQAFHEGSTGHASLIEFILNADSLPEVATGDCDVHNTLLTWALREAGIPARLTIVMDGKHGIANAFFPGIGWVAGDAVGSRRENVAQRQAPQNTMSQEQFKTWKIQEALATQRREARIKQCLHEK